MTIDPQKLPNDLSILAIKILCLLLEQDYCNVTTVARSFAPGCALVSGKVSASNHLFNLEQAGLVKRFRPADDRRQSLFTLTKKGELLVRSWQPSPALAAA